MSDLKENNFYFILSILLVSSVIGLFMITSPEVIETILCIFISVGIFIVFCLLLYLINGFMNYPLKSTFLEDLNKH